MYGFKFLTNHVDNQRRPINIDIDTSNHEYLESSGKTLSAILIHLRKYANPKVYINNREKYEEGVREIIETHPTLIPLWLELHNLFVAGFNRAFTEQDLLPEVHQMTLDFNGCQLCFTLYKFEKERKLKVLDVFIGEKYKTYGHLVEELASYSTYGSVSYGRAGTKTGETYSKYEIPVRLVANDFKWG